MGEVLTLNVGNRVGHHFVSVSGFGVESVALSRTGTTRTTGTLTGLSLRDRSDDERVHSESRVVGVLLREPRVDDVVDSVDGEGRFGDVGGENDLAGAGRRRVEDTGLHLGGEGGVDGEDDEVGDVRTEGLHTLVEDLA
jgi:hypothetical protein